MTATMPILFLKAAIRGGAMGDLFARPVQVEGHMRGGTYVAPYSGIRHTAPEPQPAPPAPMAAPDLAGGRATYPDGRMIPLPGDKVQRFVPGIFGMSIGLQGVVRGRTVQITHGATSRKTDALSPAWSVIGDPALERIAAERRAKAEAEHAAEQARRAAEAAADEAERQRLVADRGSLEGTTFTPGDMIEAPDGRLHVVSEVDAGGHVYGYPIADGEDHPGSLGRLDGWRRSDQPPPPGTIIESRYGMARRRTEGGAWEPVIYSRRANGWITEAEFGPPISDAEAARIAFTALDFMQRDSQGKGRDYRPYSRPGAMDAILEKEGRELRGTDEGRVLEAMGDIIASPDFAARLDAFRAGRLRANIAAAAPPPAPAPTPKPPAVLIIPPQPAPSPAPGALLEAERAKLARYESGTYAAREDLVELTRKRVNADPSKWTAGMGVSFKVASGGQGMQTNRGYRVMETDPDNKMLRIRLIRDGGYADAMPGQSPDMWIWMGEAQRAKADDATGEDAPPKTPRKPTGAVIHEAYSMDYSSQIHYAKDGQGRVWKRMQIKDPRYGYKWGAWKLTKGDIPARASAGSLRARLPA